MTTFLMWACYALAILWFATFVWALVNGRD
jgi:hypothetical protein